ncbi:MAG: pilin [Clostridia bacterium]|nr:pilin [Clostridia bacterium]
MKNILEISIRIILTTFLISILFCTFCNNFVYADPPGYRPQDDNKTEEFKTDEWSPSSSTFNEKRKITEIGNRIIGTIQVIGSFASVIALIIIGIRYMVGSVEEKAQYKETMVPYIIGAVLVFGITTTLRIVYDIAQSVN